MRWCWLIWRRRSWRWPTAKRCVVVALAIAADGTNKPVGLWDGATENKTVVRALLADLVLPWPALRRRTAGRARRRQGPLSGGACGVRRHGAHPALHFASWRAPDCVEIMWSYKQRPQLVDALGRDANLDTETVLGLKG